jgi:penicillin-binding protein
LTSVKVETFVVPNGAASTPQSIDSITDSTGKEIYKHKDNPVQVYSKATASIMNDMMRRIICGTSFTNPIRST